MAVITSTYFKTQTQNQKQVKNEIIKLTNSPSYNLSQKDIKLTIRDVYNEILNSTR
ncbi:hypothetical protein PFZ59_09355 [Streptococcus suis]|uniref:hypothetical protein n=1 Tax=Streptococcus suis TaxID=1307 RepID=UPI00240DD36B|nr:hypothetical protein [Streptococcus suis]WFA75360.1 hypothetical protein PFZ59_09355 [Streptococcus suis]